MVLLQEAKDIRRAKSVSSLNTTSSDKHIFESSLSQPSSDKHIFESSLSQPGSSGAQGQSGSQDNLATFMQYIKQEPVDTSFSWMQNTNISLSQGTLSSMGSSSTINSSFCSVKSEMDEDSQFSHASSSKTDSWLTEHELKPQCK